MFVNLKKVHLKIQKFEYKDFIKKYKYEIVLSGSIFLLGFVLSFFRWAVQDEVGYLKETMIMSEFLKHLKWFGNESVGEHGFLFKLPVSIIYLITGPNIWIATIFNVFIASLATILMYKIVNHFLKNDLYSFISTVFVFFSYYFIAVLHSYLRDVPVMFMMLVFLLALAKKKNFWLLGVLFMLVLDAKEYIAALLTPPLFLWIIIINWQKFKLNYRLPINILFQYFQLFIPSVLFLFLMFFTSIVPVNSFVAGILKLQAINSNITDFNIDKQKSNFGTDTNRVANGFNINSGSENNDLSSSQETELMKSIEPLKQSLEMRESSTKRTINPKYIAESNQPSINIKKQPIPKTIQNSQTNILQKVLLANNKTEHQVNQTKFENKQKEQINLIALKMDKNKLIDNHLQKKNQNITSNNNISKNKLPNSIKKINNSISTKNTNLLASNKIDKKDIAISQSSLQLKFNTLFIQPQNLIIKNKKILEAVRTKDFVFLQRNGIIKDSLKFDSLNLEFSYSVLGPKAIDNIHLPENKTLLVDYKSFSLQSEKKKNEMLQKYNISKTEAENLLASNSSKVISELKNPNNNNNLKKENIKLSLSTKSVKSEVKDYESRLVFLDKEKYSKLSNKERNEVLQKYNISKTEAEKFIASSVVSSNLPLKNTEVQSQLVNKDKFKNTPLQSTKSQLIATNKSNPLTPNPQPPVTSSRPQTTNPQPHETGTLLMDKQSFAMLSEKEKNEVLQKYNVSKTEAEKIIAMSSRDSKLKSNESMTPELKAKALKDQAKENIIIALNSRSSLKNENATLSESNKSSKSSVQNREGSLLLLDKEKYSKLSNKEKNEVLQKYNISKTEAEKFIASSVVSAKLDQKNPENQTQLINKDKVKNAESQNQSTRNTQIATNNSHPLTPNLHSLSPSPQPLSPKSKQPQETGTLLMDKQSFAMLSEKEKNEVLQKYNISKTEAEKVIAMSSRDPKLKSNESMSPELKAKALKDQAKENVIIALNSRSSLKNENATLLESNKSSKSSVQNREGSLFLLDKEKYSKLSNKEKNEVLQKYNILKTEAEKFIASSVASAKLEQKNPEISSDKSAKSMVLVSKDKVNNSESQNQSTRNTQIATNNSHPQTPNLHSLSPSPQPLSPKSKQPQETGTLLMDKQSFSMLSEKDKNEVLQKYNVSKTEAEKIIAMSSRDSKLKSNESMSPELKTKALKDQAKENVIIALNSRSTSKNENATLLESNKSSKSSVQNREGSLLLLDKEKYSKLSNKEKNEVLQKYNISKTEAEKFIASSVLSSKLELKNPEISSDKSAKSMALVSKDKVKNAESQNQSTRNTQIASNNSHPLTPNLHSLSPSPQPMSPKSKQPQETGTLLMDKQSFAMLSEKEKNEVLQKYNISKTEAERILASSSRESKLDVNEKLTPALREKALKEKSKENVIIALNSRSTLKNENPSLLESSKSSKSSFQNREGSLLLLDKEKYSKLSNKEKNEVLQKYNISKTEAEKFIASSVVSAKIEQKNPENQTQLINKDKVKNAESQNQSTRNTQIATNNSHPLTPNLHSLSTSPQPLSPKSKQPLENGTLLMDKQSFAMLSDKEKNEVLNKYNVSKTEAERILASSSRESKLDVNEKSTPALREKALKEKSKENVIIALNSRSTLKNENPTLTQSGKSSISSKSTVQSREGNLLLLDKEKYSKLSNKEKNEDLQKYNISKTEAEKFLASSVVSSNLPLKNIEYKPSLIINERIKNNVINSTQNENINSKIAVNNKKSELNNKPNSIPNVIKNNNENTNIKNRFENLVKTVNKNEPSKGVKVNSSITINLSDNQKKYDLPIIKKNIVPIVFDDEIYRDEKKLSSIIKIINDPDINKIYKESELNKKNKIKNPALAESIKSKINEINLTRYKDNENSNENEQIALVKYYDKTNSIEVLNISVEKINGNLENESLVENKKKSKLEKNNDEEKEVTNNDFKQLEISKESLIAKRGKLWGLLEFFAMYALNILLIYTQKILSPRTFSYLSYILYIVIISFIVFLTNIRKWMKESDKLFVALFYIFYLVTFILRPSHARYLLHLGPIIALFLMYFFRDGFANYKKLLIPILITIPFTIASVYYEITYPIIKVGAHIFFYSLLGLLIYFSYKQKEKLYRFFVIFLILTLSFFSGSSALFQSYSQGQIRKSIVFGQNNEYKEMAKYFFKNKIYWFNTYREHVLIQFYNKDINQGIAPWRLGFGEGAILKSWLPKSTLETKFKYIPNFYHTIGFDNIVQLSNYNIDYLALLYSEKSDIAVFPEVFSINMNQDVYMNYLLHPPEWLVLEHKVNLKNKVLYIYKIKYK